MRLEQDNLKFLNSLLEDENFSLLILVSRTNMLYYSLGMAIRRILGSDSDSYKNPF